MDPESQKLWEELKGIEEGCPSCKVVKENIKQGINYIIYYKLGMRYAAVKINFCPECGKKIK